MKLGHLVYKMGFVKTEVPTSVSVEFSDVLKFNALSYFLPILLHFFILWIHFCCHTNSAGTSLLVKGRLSSLIHNISDVRSAIEYIFVPEAHTVGMVRMRIHIQYTIACPQR